MFEVVPPKLDELIASSLDDLIFRFDQEFDLPLAHHVGIGLLETRGALTPEGIEREPLAALATYWMRMIQCDVRWDLLRGLEAMAESKVVLDRIASRAESKVERYVLARWHDASGRLQFRCGDMMAARLAFARAKAHASDTELWYCRPDIESNLLRAHFDEHEKAGESREVADEAAGFDALLERTMSTAEQLGIHIDFEALGRRLDRAVDDGTPVDAVEDLLDGMLGRQTPVAEQREFLRGLANVLHNTSIAYKPSFERGWAGDPVRAIHLARRSACLAFGLRDEVRLAQELRHGASLIEKDDTQRTRALAWQQLVAGRLRWQRGRWMAIQSIARMAPSLEAIGRLEQVLYDLDERRSLRGDDAGFDVDLYRYTLNDLAGVCRALGVDREQLIRQRRLDNAASVRRVVKVAVYRARFAQFIYPTYMAEIEATRRELEHRPGVEALEELFTQIEEVNARDLLDTFVDTTRAGDTPNDYPDEDPGIPVVARRGEGERGVPRTSRGMTDARTAIERARQRFEELALSRPMTVTPSDPEIAGAVRRLTAAEVGLVVVRYFVSGWQSAAPSFLGALLFQRGRVELVELHTTISDLAQLGSGRPPTRALAETLWSDLIEPIWSRIDDCEAISHLTLVPASGMFGLPLHVACSPSGDRRPLCARVPLSFSVSATAYLTHRRHLLRVQPRDPDDDLCALVPEIGPAPAADASTPAEQHDIYPGELEAVNWSPRRFHLAGAMPEGLARESFRYLGRGNRAGLDKLLSTRAELLLFAGHGLTREIDGDVEVALQLADGDYLTQYDLATRLRMRRNKWTILGACVSGQGADTASGEVAGFVRSFIAAGAGALAVSLWPVADEIMAAVVGDLLREIASARDEPFDIVESLRAIQERVYAGQYESVLTSGPTRNYGVGRRDRRGPAPGLLGCPLALYL